MIRQKVGRGRNTKPNGKLNNAKVKGRIGGKKRKGSQQETSGKKADEKPSRLKLAQEEISSDSDSNDLETTTKARYVSSEDEDVTAQEKRLKLAKKYLDEIEKLEDVENVSEHLKRDVLKKSGYLQTKLADQCHLGETPDIRVLRGHKLSVTCLVVSNDDKYAFSGSKDGSLIKWCLQTWCRLKVISGGPKKDSTVEGHCTNVNAIALSTDFKFLASGDDEKIVRIWNPENMSVIRNFTQHRDGITGLAFRVGSHQLFSASADRSIKIWNLDEMGYVETLFGHQDCITSIDSLLRDRALTSGGRDCTVRLWKIPEESQLVFQGSTGSIDCVCFVNEQHFISGSDNGSLCLWGIQKKKPLSFVPSAHGRQPNGDGNWITALTALPNSDLIASGSQDGYIRLWKCKEDFKSISLLSQVPIVGFVNGLRFGKSGMFLMAAIGQEHSRGRWWRIKEAKNSVIVISLKGTPK